MKKTTKKTTKKTVKKPIKDTFISHFHINHKIGLTICSKQVPDTDIYCLGMSLVHADDQGSRKQGRERAFDRCIEGLIEFDNNQKLCREWKPETGIMAFFKKLFNAKQSKPDNLMTNINCSGVYGQSGHWLIKGLEETQALIKTLRYNEGFLTQSSLERFYHQVFFRLPTVIF